MTYRIHVPGAVDGDVVTADVHGSALSVVRNGRELSPDEYQLSCDRARREYATPARKLGNLGPARAEARDSTFGDTACKETAPMMSRSR